VPGGSYTDDGSNRWGKPNMGNIDFNGTWQLSASSYSVDWDSSLNRPKSWTGTLTTRTGDFSGVITLDAGQVSDFTTALANARGDGTYNFRNIEFIDAGGEPRWPEIRVISISGDEVTFNETGDAVPLPSVGSEIIFWPGAAGFQERDLDVPATIVRKANYYFWTGSIPAEESLGGDTIAASWGWSAKPAWFGSLRWPAFDSSNPMATEAEGLVAIPAGYRSVNGHSNYLVESTPTYSVGRLKMLRR
jgi:hypothetical protein